MIVTHKFEMDLINCGIPSTIDVVQDDRYSRNLEISLTADGSACEIPENTTAMIHYVKADGTGGNYNAMPNGSEAYVIDGSVITVALAPQVCTSPGLVRLIITLLNGEIKLNTFSVNVYVHGNPGLETVSENYVKVMGMMADRGWTPNMYLATDEKGNVTVKDIEVNELAPISQALDEIIAIQETLIGGDSR